MSTLRKLLTAGAVVASVHAAEAMTYQYDIHNGHLAVLAKGPIEAGDGARFESFLANLPQDLLDQKANFVFFTSEGGLVSEAMTIARAVERNHFMTGTIGPCQSGCVLPWAAGERKYSVEGDCIGVHSASMDALAKGTPKALEKQTRENLEGVANITMAMWFWDHGAPSIVTEKILHTPSRSIYCLTDKDLADWHVKVMP